jgi:ectoine hydroxylase-related dioxygenase (phytanoyl-CoA dioxygenase family)
MLQTIESARSQYETDGFYFGPAIVPPELIARATQHMDDVIAGKYETGIKPNSRTWNPGDDPRKLIKIDDAHKSDRTIHELVSLPQLGKLAAEVTGAKMVQVWATQLLFKPPGREETGNVGWHQDRQYWKYWDGEVFTAWVALSDVTAQSGPMKMARGSHRWGECELGDFFGGNLEAQRSKFEAQGKTWEEAVAILPPGGVSFHHRFTVHGSGPNLSSVPRRSFAIHMRTEKSTPILGVSDYYVSNLDDPIRCPVIYDAR